MPYVLGTIAVVQLFFILVLCFGSNPFDRLDFSRPMDAA